MGITTKEKNDIYLENQCILLSRKKCWHLHFYQEKL